MKPYSPAPLVLTAHTTPPAMIGGPTVPTFAYQVPAALQVASQLLNDGAEALTLRLTTPRPSHVR